MVSSTCPAESTNLMTGLYCQMVLHGLIHLLLTSASAHLVIRPVEFRLLSLLKGLLNYNLNSISISANWASVSFWVAFYCISSHDRTIGSDSDSLEKSENRFPPKFPPAATNEGKKILASSPPLRQDNFLPKNNGPGFSLDSFGFPSARFGRGLAIKLELFIS